LQVLHKEKLEENEDVKKFKGKVFRSFMLLQTKLKKSTRASSILLHIEAPDDVSYVLMDSGLRNS
jgi:hypothetical protein